jgi:hypothetical protein
MYEALDSRKIQLKRRSSGDDTEKIGLKLKFAPMYTLNRMGAKMAKCKELKNKVYSL